MQLRERAFLVTGGSSGLGAACVEMLLAAGAHVVIADLKAPPAPHASYVPTDVTDDASARQAVEFARAQFGGLHGCIQCAGIALAEKTLGKEGPAPLANFERVLRINLLGTYNVARWAAWAMTQNNPNEQGERGVIVNTASVAAYEGQIGQCAYAASKGGIVSLTLPMARELARHGIRVAAIAPGIFDTPLLAGLPEAARQSLGAQIPFPSRLGHPAEFAALARHIIENPMLNGAVLRLDGALRMAPK